VTVFLLVLASPGRELVNSGFRVRAGVPSMEKTEELLGERECSHCQLAVLAAQKASSARLAPEALPMNADVSAHTGS